MRHTQAEKLEIIRLVEDSELPVTETLSDLDVSRSTFYDWYGRFLEADYDGLAVKKPPARRFWNRIPEHQRQRVVEIALKLTEMSPRELAWHITDHEGFFLSESSVYRILKDHDLITSPAFTLVQAAERFSNPTTRVHQLWQTDFTYFKIIGWGWYYLASILDDYSRYIIAWKLYTTMETDDVKDLLEKAVESAGVHHVEVRHRPRLLSDNGPCYVSKGLSEYLEEKGMAHTRGRPYHPMTQGKIERYHRSMKNIVNLDKYFLPWELEAAVGSFVDWYNNERYHESLNNVTPADVYFGRQQKILDHREIVKRRTLRLRKQENLKATQSELTHRNMLKPSITNTENVSGTL
jgi:putative transposase